MLCSLINKIPEFTGLLISVAIQLEESDKFSLKSMLGDASGHFSLMDAETGKAYDSYVPAESACYSGIAFARRQVASDKFLARVVSIRGSLRPQDMKAVATAGALCVLAHFGGDLTVAMDPPWEISELT